MGKKKIDDESDVEKWDGKNFPFTRFDREIAGWARKQWWEELGRAMWQNTFPGELFDIPELNKKPQNKPRQIFQKQILG